MVLLPHPCEVLIVDDSADDREYYCRALGRVPDGRYNTAEAVDGPDGLTRVGERPFDCVLLDYSLPGMNGLEVLRLIRSDHPHLAVVMLTGRGDIDLAVSALKQGANDYLAKAPDLADRLHHAILLAVESAANARRADASQRYLRQMLDHSPDPIFMKDEDHRWVDGNAAFWEFMAGPPERYLNRTAGDFYPPALVKSWHDAERKLLAEEGVAEAEETVPHVTGEELILITKKGVFRDLEDRKRLVGVIHDITTLRTQQQALAASEQTFREAIENAVNPMALASPEGRWLKVNRALCNLLGHAEEDLLANDIASVTHPDDRACDAEQLLSMWTEKQGVRQYEKRFLHRDGEVITVLQSVSVARHRDGTPKHMVIQMQDLTESRRIDRMKSEFISTVSHELRTPLTSIRGSLGLLGQPFAGKLSEAGRGLIDMAAENCERLVALIDEILDIDRIAAGAMRFDRKAHDVASLIDQCIKTTTPYAQKFGIGIARGTTPGRGAIFVDKNRFVQVMSNLISNAVKFSRDGGIVDVLTHEVGDGKIRICVADHGPGIPEEFRGRIFGRFAQADSSVARSRNGTGLGLHITRQLVEAMDGVIGFDSETGVGTTFWVEFPLSDAQECDDPTLAKD
ncbi:MAG TPA: PAS domain S-box protein [Sphingobium sp.]|nr:PAS domain S-box protein [Sphingobium sp.]